ncbi:MAG: type II toxin-antitoxin system VapC family toxin [Bryobacterales bacterium]|nr:type II toxin-antitoxin system VapC family toxin [Bryobacterales bacterium]MBV9399487.1 type II toxin-antitoxin system VapC family toxin [Bryobacterales bacterium]
MIIDTNSLSAILDGDESIKAFLPPRPSIPVVVLGEFRFGAAQSRKREHYERWLNQNLRYYDVLPVTEETAISYAEIRAELKLTGSPIPSNDVWIAALCRQHSLPLLSRDRHFDRVKDLHRVAW